MVISALKISQAYRYRVKLKYKWELTEKIVSRWIRSQHVTICSKFIVHIIHRKNNCSSRDINRKHIYRSQKLSFSHSLSIYHT